MVSTLEKFGVLSICVIAIHFTRILTDYFHRKSLEEFYRKNKLRELGQWGVVLGADKSIGQAYAVELAKQGLNMILIGDNLAKLSNLSNLLEKYFQVFTGIIVITFSINEHKYLQKALSNLDIAILVNAPDYGDGLTQPEYFLKIPNLDQTLSLVINRNLLMVTKMCAIVLPGMVLKGKGIIVNVSSIASKTSCPLMALYGASAAYVEKLSEELRNEYSSSGVIVQTLLPGYVLSNSQGKNTKWWIIPSPKAYVGSAIKGLWIEGETCGFIPHGMVHGILLRIQSLCPKMTASVIRRMMESSNDAIFQLVGSGHIPAHLNTKLLTRLPRETVDVICNPPRRRCLTAPHYIITVLAFWALTNMLLQLSSSLLHNDPLRGVLTIIIYKIYKNTRSFIHGINTTITLIYKNLNKYHIV